MDYSDYIILKPILPNVRWGYTDKNMPESWGLIAEIPGRYSEESYAWIWKQYTEDEARKIVNFVEQQILKLQLSGTF